MSEETPEPLDSDDTPTPDRFSGPFPRVRAARLVMGWLLRLRWIAVVGQLAATIVARLLHLSVPLGVVLTLIGITAASNVALAAYIRRRPIPTWLILAVLLVDMCLLTILLRFTGGPQNPFSSLYLIHIAMAVTLLGSAWAWIAVGAAGLLYGLLLAVPAVPLASGRLPSGVTYFGAWMNLVLIAGLITYFSNRVNRSLRWRELHINALRIRNARNEKLSTLTTLAAGAAHELGTPLATIAVAAHELELAISRLQGSEDMVEDAQLIRQECNRCRLILDRMRVDVASDPRAGRTEMAELLRQLNGRLREDEQERLEITGPREGFAIAAPGPAIEQSLTVMIRNAMDADPSGKPVRLAIRLDGELVIFDVIDRGVGMSSEVLKRVGEPFFTTKEAGRGMGLGLFLVRLVAENYRGRFRITSKPNQGTQSTLILPLEPK
ncbi:MAG: ATP-binding protein [Tepidisphaeraceae bacterium]